jgi:beta-lactam-binding protein with PASTA domain
MGTQGLKVLFFTLVVILMARAVQAQEAPKTKSPAEKIYPGEFEAAWDKAIEVLTEKGLSDHPHGKMSADKDSGKITTPVFRYFKILSAKPVKEIDYRDSYTITVSRTDTGPSSPPPAAGKPENGAEAPKAAPKGKGRFVKIQVQRKFELYDENKKQWVDGNPAQENVGYTEEALLNAIAGDSAAAAEGAKPNLNATPPLNPG